MPPKIQDRPACNWLVLGAMILFLAGLIVASAHGGTGRVARQAAAPTTAPVVAKASVPPPATPPVFVIGVCQQAAAYPLPSGLVVDNFARWKERGVNTLVDIPSWSDGHGDQHDREWVDAATAAGLWQIRKPVGDLMADAANPFLLAWSSPDEIDRTNEWTVATAIE